ncbi:MAG: serine/threonine protein kinase, partial [Oscillospiraceae bacterium]|nr:serine/threonine protein kinase [Oscillospiraceae bacterium]
MRICMGCMERIDDTADICPLCGYKKGTPPREAYHLPPETILRGRYIVGRVIGYGGFGVTYIGLDAQLERKIAIKEFLPSDFATRMPGDINVTVYANDAQEQFEAGLKSFVDEAHRLARFNSKPGIVDIYDSFSENLTAYIVMQFLDGKTVKQIMQEEGAFPYERARDIILPVLKTLQDVHQENVIHRDIAPDNIFITKDGEVKLLDFGAARYATTFHSKSLSVILKPGYAPEEQYRSRGNQGAWTDVYATAATFYKMITGVTPEESMERAMKDTVQEPSRLGVAVPKNAETAIMNAMNVRIEDRTQSAEEF